MQNDSRQSNMIRLPGAVKALSHLTGKTQREREPNTQDWNRFEWTAPSMQQWKALYEAADEIKRLKPWEKLWDTCLFALQMPEKEEPIYFSVMGRNKECFGIGVYPGYDSISSYYRLMQSHDGEPIFVTMSYQNGIVCYFGARDELSSRDYRVIKHLGLKYRGKDQWPYFRTFRTGFYPWQPDSGEADILIPALQQFVKAYKAYADGKVSVDFENGQMLLRFYAKEQKRWKNTACDELPLFKGKQPVTMTDELLVARLKSQKRVRTTISLDIIYVPYSIQQSNATIPFYPRILLLLDEISETIQIQHFLDVREDETEQILKALSEYIQKSGRPYSLHVRDDRVGCVVEDLCDKIGVKLVKNKGLPVLDYLASSLVDYMAGI